MRGGHVDTHPAALPPHVELPADPDEREALAHQKSVAQVCVGRRVGGAAAIEPAEHELTPAIENFDERNIVRVGRILGTKDVQIGLKLDAPGRIYGRLADVGNHAIARIFRIDREMHDADDLLVSRRADVRTLRHVHAAHFRAEPGHEAQHHDRREGKPATGAFERHAAQYSALVCPRGASSSR